MKNTIIPTAEEFLGNNDKNLVIQIAPYMRQFAKMHVEAALKAASEKLDGQRLGIDHHHILNCYPLSNIK